MTDARKNQQMARARALKFGFKPKFNPKPVADLEGKTFGKWKVLKRALNRHHRSYWLCKCECGDLKEVSSQTLLNNTSKCCVKCSPRETFVTHGLCRNKKSLEYHIWNSIKNRCRNSNDKSYLRYGGRGIDICDQWYNSFAAFIESVGKKPFPKATLDRIDNAKGYSPDNVRWTTLVVQAGNTRRQPLIDGQRICISKLAKEINRCRFWVSRKLKQSFLPEQLIDMEGPPYKEYIKNSAANIPQSETQAK